MKKVLFVVYSLGIGGVEKSLLNLLSVLPDSITVSILVMEKKGEYLKDLPCNVDVYESSFYKEIKWMIKETPFQVLKKLLIKRKFLFALCFLYFSFYRKLTQNSIPLYEFLFKKDIPVTQSYDMAIAYAGPSTLIDYFTVKKISAKKKIGWIHFDISKFGIDKMATHLLYSSYDRIFCVSETAKKIFDSCFLQFQYKTEVFYNLISRNQILDLAFRGESFIDSFDGKRILTVGRISSEKGQDNAIKALKILIEKGYNVKWYFVGDGAFRNTCENLVREYKLEDFVVFLGTKNNPYPYMRDCDIYVQPSRYEACCVTITEVKIFKKNIVATDATGNREQLKDMPNSRIVGFTEQDIANGIISLFDYPVPVSDCFECECKNDLNKLLSLLES